MAAMLNPSLLCKSLAGSEGLKNLATRK